MGIKGDSGITMGTEEIPPGQLNSDSRKYKCFGRTAGTRGLFEGRWELEDFLKDGEY